MSFTPEWCPGKNLIPSVDLITANWSFTSNLDLNKRGPKEKGHLKGKLTSRQAYSWGHWFICWNTLGLLTLQFCRLLKKSLGSQQRRTKDETNEKIQQLLAIKRSVHQAHLAQTSPCEESHLLSCMQQPPAQTKWHREDVVSCLIKENSDL